MLFSLNVHDFDVLDEPNAVGVVIVVEYNAGDDNLCIYQKANLFVYTFSPHGEFLSASEVEGQDTLLYVGRTGFDSRHWLNVLFGEQKFLLSFRIF